MFDFLKKTEKTIKTTQTLKTPKTDYSNITPICEYFYRQTGITFDSQISILQRKVNSFCQQRNIYSYDTLLQELQIDLSLKQAFIDYLTTNETYFYREFKQVQELTELVKKSNKNVKILCAPSATGEEVYSIAIALLEAGISPSSFHILGIDINASAISKAHNALYSQKNLRKLSADIISTYFEIDKEKYKIKQSLKSLVSFQVANIFDNSFKNIGKFDFIFSRNMLIYFDNETKLKAKSILESLRKNDKQEIFFGHADLF